MFNKPTPGSLKAKKLKSKGKKVTRNVLTLPTVSNWCTVEDEDIHSIENILKEYLCPVKCSKPVIPWYVLMKMTKEQRKDKHKEALDALTDQEKSQIVKAKEIRKHLTIGINSSIRGLEHKKLAFCLIDSDSQPEIVVNKLMTLCQEKGILSTKMPNLKSLTKELMGFPVLVLGFKESVMDEACTIKGCTQIKDILEECNSAPSNTEMVMTRNKENKPQTSLETQQRLTDIYLFRTSKMERIFHPVSNEIVPSDFIGISGDRLKDNRISRKTFKRYTDTNQDNNDDNVIFESPVIVTVQNNPNKRKKKR